VEAEVPSPVFAGVLAGLPVATIPAALKHSIGTDAGRH
jgi:hypothetical protein